VVHVSVAGGRIVVEREGIDRLLARHRIEFPVDHVVWVQTRPDEAFHGPTGSRVPGTHLPGAGGTTGTFRGSDGDVFWDVHDPGHSLAIGLRDEALTALVIEVEDPDRLEREIVRALRGDRRTLA
jgi:hypothetical protein